MTNLIFFGSDRYSAIVLHQLLTTNYQILRVVTDRHADPSPVEKLAKEHNLKVAYYPDFDHDLITEDTLGLCASFDHLIPKEIIAKFGGHLYNLHPSLLPQYRNVSPVQYAIALGDHTTGITLFHISTGIDDGEIIAQAEEEILPDDTTATLTPRLFTKGAQLFIDSLVAPSGSGLAGQNNLPARPDPMGTLIFTRRLTRNSGFIEWSALHRLLTNQPILPADTANELLRLRLSHHSSTIYHLPSTILCDLLRALTPWPSVWSIVPTRKGDLRITVPYQLPTTNYQILISGKPNPISLSDFTKYYL